MKFDYIKYAALITLELRVDHNCMSMGIKTREECHLIRFKYNGDFLDILNGNIHYGSAIESDGPGVLPDTTSPIDSQIEKTIQQKYDITYKQWAAKISEVLYPGDQIESLCAQTWQPDEDIKLQEQQSSFLQE
mmetsp:Transcript_14507/g.24760  ORF Transcript_14507/g.24760 Transcript_14507/m.24760 type:complete len:133 (-) Transcript_14507:43-441(-)